MRTTIDLDDALLARLRESARREGVSFRAFLHRVILRGLKPEPPYVAQSFSMGEVLPGFDLVKANQIAADLEDEEIVRKMSEGR